MKQMLERGIMSFMGCCASFFWRYAWINYITLAVFGWGFPLPGAAVFFLLSYALTAVTSRRGFRLITIAVFHAAGFSLLLLGFLHSFYDVSVSIFAPRWIAGFFSAPRALAGWLSLILLMLMPVLIWAGGINLVRKRENYTSGYTGLDIGITAFFLLFLVKFIARTQVNTVVDDPAAIRSFFLFFITCISGILVSKQREHVDLEFSSHRRGIGVIISFIVIIAVITVFAVLLMPLLSTAADTGYGVLKVIGAPLGGVLVRILRFLLGGQRIRPDAQTGGGDSGGATEAFIETVDEQGFLGVILGYIALGLVALVSAVLVAALLWTLVCRLLKRTDNTERIKQPPFFRYIMELLKKLILPIKMLLSNRKTGIDGIYSSLLKWGARGGIARKNNETPEEYKKRLCEFYPFASFEIGTITDSFNMSCYGEKVSGENEYYRALRCLKQLKSPGLIPARIISWFRR